MKYKKAIIFAVLSTLLLATALILVSSRSDTGNKKVNYEKYEESNLDTIDQAYFGDKLEFDARKILNLQGKNVHFYWNFGDGSSAEGAKVEHIYEFKNEYDLEYPVYYTITLMAFDGAKSISTTRLIRLYPKSYTFYFDKDKMTTEMPLSNKEMIKVASKFDLESIEGLTYKFDNTVKISRCNFLVTIYLEKPVFSKINRISIVLLDKYGGEIERIDREVDVGFFWKSKKIEIKGSLNKEVELGSIKILLYGFSISKRAEIMYGYGKPSNICFMFN